MATKLTGGRLKPADYEIPRVCAKVPPKTTLADLMLPGYWQNYASNLQEGTEITVVSEDYELDVKLRVLEINPLRARMRVLSVASAPDEKDFDAEEERSQEVDGLSIKWGGPKAKFRVINGDEVLESGIATKEEAQERMAELAAG